MYVGSASGSEIVGRGTSLFTATDSALLLAFECLQRQKFPFVPLSHQEKFPCGYCQIKVLGDARGDFEVSQALGCSRLGHPAGGCYLLGVWLVDLKVL